MLFRSGGGAHARPEFVDFRFEQLSSVDPTAETAWLGAVELTNGVLALPDDRAGFVLCAALLGWGGLSVHAQTLSVLEDSGLSARFYFLGKAMQAALSAPLAWLVSNILY